MTQLSVRGQVKPGLYYSRTCPTIKDMAQLKPCPEPNCPQLVEQGRCSNHRRNHELRRGSRQARGYTRVWEHASRQFLDEFPLCGQRPNNQPPVMSECFEQRRLTPAYQTDHVVPHHGDTGLFWDREGNWQSLCRSCGAKKSAAGL